jgi:hypothetical protein
MSLLQSTAAAPDEERYRILRVVRLCAAGLLEDSPEAELLAEGHAHFFVTFAEDAASELAGPDAPAWFDVLDSEREDLLAAMAWLRRNEAVGPALRLGGAAHRFWYMRGHLALEREWLEYFLDCDESHDPEVVTPQTLDSAPRGAGALACAAGDRDAALRHTEDGLVIYRNLDDKETTAKILDRVGAIATTLGKYDAARRACEELGSDLL